MKLEQLEKLAKLKEQGVLTEEEFAEQKARILAQADIRLALNRIIEDEKLYSMLMHFALFFAFVLPVLGWVLPLVMWLYKKETPYIDQQGRIIANWIISAFIYLLVSLLLTFVFIGFVMLLVLLICSIIFIIQGAIRAKEGRIANYPLAFNFFSVAEDGMVADTSSD